MLNLTTDCRCFATHMFLILILAIAACPLSVAAQDEPISLPSLDPGQLSEPPQESADGADNELPQPELLDDENLDFVLRGPVHEAFAQAYQKDSVVNEVISARPPEPIKELAPEQKPEGNNVQWIPGYWFFNDEEERFLWISGLWRDVPEGRHWEQGQWEEVAGGYQWTPGYWAVASHEVNYTPQPPASIDNGPSYEAPGDDYFYIPGNWLYHNEQFVWQSGYWCPRITNRIWIPSHYISTSRGYIYCSGYWDYPIDERGILYAPVHFHRPVYLAASWYYRPRCVVETHVDFLIHLFVRPTRSCYYFGDWYDCGTRSYRPWVHSHYHSTYHDPLFAYYRYRGFRCHDSNDYLINHLYKRHRHHAKHGQYRPHHTWREQNQHRDLQVHKHIKRPAKSPSLARDVTEPVARTRVARVVEPGKKPARPTRSYRTTEPRPRKVAQEQKPQPFRPAQKSAVNRPESGRKNRAAQTAQQRTREKEEALKKQLQQRAARSNENQRLRNARDKQATPFQSAPQQVKRKSSPATQPDRTRSRSEVRSGNRAPASSPQRPDDRSSAAKNRATESVRRGSATRNPVRSNPPRTIDSSARPFQPGSTRAKSLESTRRANPGKSRSQSTQVPSTIPSTPRQRSAPGNRQKPAAQSNRFKQPQQKPGTQTPNSRLSPPNGRQSESRSTTRTTRSTSQRSTPSANQRTRQPQMKQQPARSPKVESRPRSSAPRQRVTPPANSVRSGSSRATAGGKSGSMSGNRGNRGSQSNSGNKRGGKK